MADDLTSTDAPAEFLNFPSPTYSVSPASQDLGTAANAAHRLICTIQFFVHCASSWFGEVTVRRTTPTGEQVVERVVPPILSDEQVNNFLGCWLAKYDDRLAEYIRLVQPLLGEFSCACGGFAEGGLYASSAAEAVWKYAAAVRSRVNIAATQAMLAAGGEMPPPLQYLPTAALVNHWNSIRQFVRNSSRDKITSDWLTSGLPSPDAILARLVEAVFKADAARAEPIRATAARRSGGAVGPTPTSTPGGESLPAQPSSPLLPVDAIVAALGLPPERLAAVDAVLRRMTGANSAIRTSVELPRKGEPHYVYRVPHVWPELVESLPRWR